MKVPKTIDHYYTYKESQNQTFGTILNPTVPKEVVYSKYFVESKILVYPFCCLRGALGDSETKSSTFSRQRGPFEFDPSICIGGRPTLDSKQERKRRPLQLGTRDPLRHIFARTTEIFSVKSCEFSV